MALSFRLNRHEDGKKYRIGDHLTGVVNIHSMERMAFDVYEVSVSLRCYSDANLYYSEGEFGTWYKEKRTLLEVSQTLTSQTFTIEHDTEWLFDIEIPANFTPNGTGFVALAPLSNPPLFDPRPEQPIPPTTELGNRPGFVQGEGDMKIFYVLEAEVRQSGTPLNSTDARRSIEVFIVSERRPEPLPTTLQRKEKSVSIKSLLLNAGVSATLKQKLHATFHSDLVPESHFTVALLAPECVAPGQPFTLHFRVEHDFQNSNAQEIPLVELTALEIRLKRKEIVRTSVTVSSRHTTATWRHEKDVRSVFYLERRLPIAIAENTRLSEHGISLITPDIMPEVNDSGLPSYEDVVEDREVAGVSTSERPQMGLSRLPSYHSAVSGPSRR
jgi:hypothetical protein